MLLISAVVCGTAGLIINKAAGNPSELSKRAVLEIGGLVLVLWAVGVVLLLFAVSRFSRAARAQRQERDQAAARRVTADHLARARRVVEQLLAEEVPAAEQVWDVVLQPGERILLDGSVGYSRYYGYGAPSTYAAVGSRHNGNAGSGGASIDRAASRPQAEQVAVAAAARWRDQQQARVVVTDRRLLCQVQSRGWVSFDHRSATAIQAVPDKRSVVLEYPDTAPVRLAGPVVAEIMVIVVWALYGADGLRQHPALAEVRATLPAAALLPDMTAEQPPISDEPATDLPRLDLLAFVATHELVLAEHAALLLGVSEPEAAEQLEDLLEEGLVSRVRLSVYAATAYRVTQLGADRVDTAPPPQRPLDLAGYRHAVAARDVRATAHSAARPPGSAE